MAHETEHTGGEPAADNGQVTATLRAGAEVGRRNLNRQIAQRQKALLIGVGAIALVGGATLLFSGDNDEGSGASGEAVTIDTGGLVNRNLSERELSRPTATGPMPRTARSRRSRKAMCRARSSSSS